MQRYLMVSNTLLAVLEIEFLLAYVQTPFLKHWQVTTYFVVVGKNKWAF